MFFENGIFENSSIPKINIICVKAVEVHKHLRIWGESCRNGTPAGVPESPGWPNLAYSKRVTFIWGYQLTTRSGTRSLSRGRFPHVSYFPSRQLFDTCQKKGKQKQLGVGFWRVSVSTYLTTALDDFIIKDGTKGHWWSGVDDRDSDTWLKLAGYVAESVQVFLWRGLCNMFFFYSIRGLARISSRNFSGTSH
jgi:hypothetical protein